VREELGLSREVTLIGTVGRLASQKGQTYLLRALPCVVQEHPQTHLVFIGEGPQEAELRGLAVELGVAGLLEAMAAKRPVIATNITGNREVVDDGINGVLCQPMNSTALAKALIDLIENPKKARLLGERAREKVEQHFEEQMMLKQTLELYRAQIEGAAEPFDRRPLGSAL